MPSPIEEAYARGRQEGRTAALAEVRQVCNDNGFNSLSDALMSARDTLTVPFGGQFRVGQPVEKHTGDYQLAGEVRAVFFTKAGKERYVVEHVPGFLHIYGPQNIRSLP